MLCIAILGFKTIVNFFDDPIKCKNYDYGDLPPHIIAQILSLLRIAEFRNASVTCKSWYYASADPLVTKNIRVHPFIEPNRCDCFVRPICNVLIEPTKWDKVPYRKFLQKFGTTITEIQILSDITVTQLFEFFIYLSNVKVLKVEDFSQLVSIGNFDRSKKMAKYKNVIIPNLAQIKQVDIVTKVSDLKLYRLFLSYCVNIEKLHWKSSAYAKDSNSFLYDYLLNPLENKVLYDLTDLKMANIDRKQNSTFFKKMIQLELTNIKRLSLAEISPTYYDVMFSEFCKMYSSLKSFSISGCNNQHLSDICNYMKHLNDLSLINCTALNFSELLNLKNLEQLRIYRVDVLDNSDLIVMFKNIKNLKKLQLNDIDCDVLNAICENCKNLEDLELEEMRTQQCEPIFRNLLNLKKMSLCFTGHPKMHSSRIKSSDRYNITNLKKLEHLYCVYCVPGITPELVQQLPRIKKGCELIWDPTEEDLATYWNVDDTQNDSNSEEKPGIYDISDFNWWQN